VPTVLVDQAHLATRCATPVPQLSLDSATLGEVSARTVRGMCGSAALTPSTVERNAPQPDGTSQAPGAHSLDVRRVPHWQASDQRDRSEIAASRIDRTYILPTGKADRSRAGPITGTGIELVVTHVTWVRPPESVRSIVAPWCW
jgi:hypothetical protein